MSIFEWYKKRKYKIKQLQDNVSKSDTEMILKAFNEDKKALYSDWQHIGNDFPIRK